MTGEVGVLTNFPNYVFSKYALFLISANDLGSVLKSDFTL